MLFFSAMQNARDKVAQRNARRLRAKDVAETKEALQAGCAFLCSFCFGTACVLGVALASPCKDDTFRQHVAYYLDMHF
jgi:hypothetical protein